MHSPRCICIDRTRTRSNPTPATYRLPTPATYRLPQIDVGMIYGPLGLEFHATVFTAAPATPTTTTMVLRPCNEPACTFNPQPCATPPALTGVPAWPPRCGAHCLQHRLALAIVRRRNDLEVHAQ